MRKDVVCEVTWDHRKLLGKSLVCLSDQWTWSLSAAYLANSCSIQAVFLCTFMTVCWRTSVIHNFWLDTSVHFNSRINWLDFGRQRSRLMWPHVHPILVKAISQKHHTDVHSDSIINGSDFSQRSEVAITIHAALVNTTSQEDLDAISSNLAQTST